jgi:aminopeptidase N
MKRFNCCAPGVIWAVALAFTVPLCGQEAPQASRADVLRGEYGRYRANNDLLWYHLDIRVDPKEESVAGKNSIRFRMLKEDDQIQLDLYAHLELAQVLWNDQPLEFERELNAVLVKFPQVLPAGEDQTIVVHFSGKPKTEGRFGGIAFRKDPVGRPWINTACEGEGSSFWWPSKDQWRDEPESMDISVAVPNDLVDVSNGRFLGKLDLGDGYTRWDWRVHYPINAYNVSLNIGAYEHFSDALGDLTLDFFALPEDLDKAKTQFTQVKPMLEAFLHYFGDYPFEKDGYKLIQVPYTGMEHQSAVTYGNGFQNGYYGRDWTGVGVSPKFDFIIIHESGHEWFGNAVSAADVSDMWIHEGWTTYLECLYVEHVFGPEDALKYINGYKAKVQNRQPIITARGVHRTPSQDMYFKGALFLHTLRGVLNDDDKWFALIRDVYQTFKYQSILTEDMLPKFNECFQRDMTPIFDQYLRQAHLPILQLAFDDTAGTVAYRWRADQADFDMPIRVGSPDHWQTIQPTTEWQTMLTTLDKQAFDVDDQWHYVEVRKMDAQEMDQIAPEPENETGGE